MLTAAELASTSFSLTNTRTLASPRPIPSSSPSPIPGPTMTADVLLNVDSLASLRAAIAYANSHPGPDTITFDRAVFGTKRQTIRLTGGPLVFSDPATTTIVGPGARRLTISGGGKSGVVDVEAESLSLSGVTIVNGNADLGGGWSGWRNDGGRLALTNVRIQGNLAIVGGGLFNDGRTTPAAVSIKGNSRSRGQWNIQTTKRGDTVQRRVLGGHPQTSPPSPHRGSEQRESHHTGTRNGSFKSISVRGTAALPARRARTVSSQEVSVMARSKSNCSVKTDSPAPQQSVAEATSFRMRLPPLRRRMLATGEAATHRLRILHRPRRTQAVAACSSKRVSAVGCGVADFGSRCAGLVTALLAELASGPEGARRRPRPRSACAARPGP